MKIVIDPGHGGSDPGAIGIQGTRESDVVLSAALELEKMLKEAGYEVVMTRKKDVKLSLAARAEIANVAEADLFVSIHCNGFTNSGATGTEVFSYPGDSEGAELAGKILSKVCGALGTKNRGIKTENFAVLRLTKMTSVLIETAFITNAAEEQMMLEEGYSLKLAGAIAEGIYAYAGVAPAVPAKPDHWAKTHLDSLIRKGFISNPEQWENFEGTPKTAMVLALIDKITEEK